MRNIILAALLAAPVAAHADQLPPLHDIPWYTSHPSERNATLRWCRVSSERPDMVDCRNAQAGANGERAKRGGDPLALWDTHEYYVQHPMARIMILHACNNPGEPGAGIYLRFCSAAR